MPLFQPRGWQNIPSLSSFFYYYSVVSGLMLCIYFLIHHNRIVKDINVLLLVTYYSSYLIATALKNPEDLWYVITKVIFLITIFIFLLYYFKDNYQKCINIMAAISKLYLLINFAVTIIYPEGFGERIIDSDVRGYYFLGERNSILYAMIPMLAIVLYQNYQKDQRFKKISIFYFLISLIAMLISGSSTGIFVLIIMAIMLFYVHIHRRFSLKLLTILYVFFWISLVILQNTNIIATWIAPFFGKTGSRALTFSQRTTLWISALELIRKSPILGYGGWLRNYIQFFTNVSLYSAHNAILQLILDIGIFGLITFLVLLYFNISTIRIKKIDFSGQIIVISIFCYLIYFMMEAAEFRYVILLLFLLKYKPESSNYITQINE